MILFHAQIANERLLPRPPAVRDAQEPQRSPAMDITERRCRPDQGRRQASSSPMACRPKTYSTVPSPSTLSGAPAMPPMMKTPSWRLSLQLKTATGLSGTVPAPPSQRDARSRVLSRPPTPARSTARSIFSDENPRLPAGSRCLPGNRPALVSRQQIRSCAQFRQPSMSRLRMGPSVSTRADSARVTAPATVDANAGASRPSGSGSSPMSPAARPSSRVDSHGFPPARGDRHPRARRFVAHVGAPHRALPREATGAG